jgi:hypothetical protein
VGLRLYNVYMISKNGCDWFHQVLTSFALDIAFFCKSENVRRILSFSRLCHTWPVKRQGILYCTHMWPRGILS